MKFLIILTLLAAVNAIVALIVWAFSVGSEYMNNSYPGKPREDKYGDYFLYSWLAFAVIMVITLYTYFKS